MPEKDVKRPKTKREIGVPYGSGYFFGRAPDDEYLSTLKFPQGLAIYDKMRRSDPQISAVLNAIFNPIKSATWRVEPASDSAKDKEIAEFIEKNLFPTKEKTKKGPKLPKMWEETLKEILMYISFGFSVMEKVYTFIDGKIWLEKLSPRLPKTIKEFVHEGKKFSKVVQQVSGQTHNIPASKAVVFTANKEGASLQGISYLRPVYKPWSIKVDLQRIQAIAFERYGVGTPHGTLPEGKSDKDPEGVALADALESISSNELSYLMTPFETEVNMLAGGGESVPDMQKAIDYCDQQITISFLAQFLNLGISSFGSRALGNTFVDFFTNTIEGIGDYVASKLNQHVVHELVDFNFNVENYPMLVMNRIDSVDIDNISVLLDSGGLTATIDIENAIRKSMRFAPISKEDFDKAKNPIDPLGEGNEDGSAGQEKSKGKNDSKLNKKDIKTAGKPKNKALSSLINKILNVRIRRRRRDVI